MDFDEEMKEVSNAETTGSYISEAGVELVTVKSYKMSPSDHKGVPFIEFTFETCDDKKAINNSKFYRVTEKDSVEVRGYKNKGIKEFLTNAGADWTQKGELIIKSAVTNKVKVLFRKEEYVGVDKNQNNMPVVKTTIKYLYSGPADKEMNGNQSYLFKALKPADQNKFEGEMAKWKRDNPNGGTPEVSKAAPVENNTPPADDDLPF